MKVPLIFLSIIIAVIIYNIALSFYDDKRKKAFEDYIRDENVNKFVPKTKLESINYIKVDSTRFEYLNIAKIQNNTQLANLYEIFMKIIQKPMANFHKISNTELKNTYGMNNINEVLSFDENYTTLLSHIITFANALVSYGYLNEAMKILELGMDTNSDISKNYTMLAEIYAKLGYRKQLFALVDTVKANPNLSQQKIISQINNIMEKNNGGKL